MTSLFNHANDYIAENQHIINFINGLDVANELHEVQKKESGIFSRLVDEVVGKINNGNDEIQNHIDEQILMGLRACADLLMEQEKETLFYADILLNIKNTVAQHTEQIHQLESKNQALEQMLALIDQWQTGSLRSLSPLGKCYWVADALCQGEFGKYIQQYPKQAAQYLHLAGNQIIIRLQAELHSESAEKISLIHWITPSKKPDSGSLIQKTLQQQGQKSLAKPTHFPTIFTATQWPYLPAEILQKYHHIPFASQSIEQTVQKMMKEVFERENHD